MLTGSRWQIHRWILTYQTHGSSPAGRTPMPIFRIAMDAHCGTFDWTGAWRIDEIPTTCSFARRSKQFALHLGSRVSDRRARETDSGVQADDR